MSDFRHFNKFTIDTFDTSETTRMGDGWKDGRVDGWRFIATQGQCALIIEEKKITCQTSNEANVQHLIKCHL